MSYSKYTKEQLIKQIQQFSAKYKRVPCTTDVRATTKEIASLTSFTIRFGSWNKALEAAGFNPIQVRHERLTTQCCNCGKSLTFRPCILKHSKRKTKNIFCSKSCSTTYNNKNKKFGIRRSKLEKFVEENITKDFPSLTFLFNNKTIINSELDIYCPSLRLAIELNGIIHYEPIYGHDKFEKIQNNDKQKAILCNEKGIELAIINVSQQSYVNSKTCNQYYQYVKELINLNLKRSL